MADKPIIFSGPMVRALLDGAKTQTRRVLSLKGHRTFSEFGPSDTAGYDWHFRDAALLWHDHTHASLCKLLPYAAGDRLWAREAFWTCDECGYRNMCEGGANHSGHIGRWCCASCDELLPRAKTSPIFMPRWASRLTLTVTDVRVQRLQEISAADSLAEGVQCHTCKAMGQSACNRRGCFASIDAFRAIWDHINGPGAWAENPWVAAYTFTVHRCNIDQMPWVADG